MNSQLTYPTFETLDDLLNNTYRYIFENGIDVRGKRGGIKETLNFAVTLTNCRARTSRSLDRRLVRSKFAEFAWYMSKDSSKDYINPYISAYNDEEAENNKILGAYGPKIFGSYDKTVSQFDRVFQQISERKDTKQAYIVISDQSDYKVRIDTYSSPPCTIGLHFIIRNGMLNLTAYMRSNDAYFGLPHDLFCFTMLQEMLACRLGIPPGTYTHVCTSMHIYENHFGRVQNYLEEGYFEGIFMPKMTSFNKDMLKSVVDSFDNKVHSVDINHLDSYWHDYCLFANRNFDNINEEDWLNLFNLQELKDIATCSIAK